MLIADLPTRVQIPFAQSAGGGFVRDVPVDSQIGITDGAASFTTGFPPDCFLPQVAGGVPPFGQDVNGLLRQVTAWSRWQAAGAPTFYDVTFSTAVSGYPAGSIVASKTVVGYFWLNLVDANTSDPDAGGANWVAFSALGPTTGDMKFRPTAETLPGWIKANATTIGNAASNATQLASALAQQLFAWHWANFSNTQCPVLTSGGVPTTRGATAAADFAANRQITVLDWRGVGPKGVDGMGNSTVGAYTNVLVVSGGATTPGSMLGENAMALAVANLALHNHVLTDPSHAHGINDPSHAHTYTDPAHHHLTTSGTTFGGNTGSVGVQGGSTATAVTGPVNLGGVFTNNTLVGITINAANTGITVLNQFTGITLANTGSGTPHDTTDLSMMVTWYIKL